MTYCRFPKKLKSPDALCELSWPVAEVIECGCYVRARVKVSCLEGPACWSSTTMKKFGCSLVSSGEIVG